MNDFTFLIPISDTLRIAWEKVKGSKTTFWCGYAYIIVIAALLQLILNVSEGHHVGSGLGITQFFGTLILTLLEFGLIYMGIRRAFDLSIEYNQVFRGFDRHLIIKVLLLCLLQIFILFIVAMICIIPAVFYGASTSNPSGLLMFLLYLIPVCALIYIWIRLFLSNGLVIDKELNPLDAVKKSFEGTKNNFWRILAITLLLIIIIILSAIPLGIGLLWTIPFSFIAYGVIYKSLQINIKSP
jgi:hypothetical protein